MYNTYTSKLLYYITNIYIRVYRYITICLTFSISYKMSRWDWIWTFWNSRRKNLRTLVIWHIVVSLFSEFIFGILVAYIPRCSRRRWFTEREPEQTSYQQPTGTESTYQELDLSKMNSEDNYQSLRGNVSRIDDVANNDDDSTYTVLLIYTYFSFLKYCNAKHTWYLSEEKTVDIAKISYTFITIRIQE